MTNVVAENGPQIIGKLALIIGVAYLGYIIHVLVVYGLSVRFLSKMNSPSSSSRASLRP